MGEPSKAREAPSDSYALPIPRPHAANRKGNEECTGKRGKEKRDGAKLLQMHAEETTGAPRTPPRRRHRRRFAPSRPAAAPRPRRGRRRGRARRWRGGAPQPLSSPGGGRRPGAPAGRRSPRRRRSTGIATSRGAAFRIRRRRRSCRHCRRRRRFPRRRADSLLALAAPSRTLACDASPATATAGTAPATSAGTTTSAAAPPSLPPSPLPPPPLHWPATTAPAAAAAYPSLYRYWASWVVLSDPVSRTTTTTTAFSRTAASCSERAA